MKDKKYLSVIIPVLCIVAVIFVILAYNNEKDGKTLSQQNSKMSSQIEASTESESNSPKSNKLKSQINKLEKDIEDINDYAQEKGLLEKIAKKIIDLLTFEFPTEQENAEIKSEIKKLMTKDCYSDFIDKTDIDNDLSTSYEQGLISYSNINTNNPKVFLRTTYESNEEESTLRYFDISFKKQKGGSYLIDNIKII